jgi:hypothetical protein
VVNLDRQGVVNLVGISTLIRVDTNIITSGWGGVPILSRGTTPGEFYLMRARDSADYRQYCIFHTNNYGTTFEVKGITTAYSTTYWHQYFTAGRAPGSFYIMRNRIDSTSLLYYILCIDYSQDYGATFTTYCHDLTPGYTAIEQKTSKGKDDLLQNYPNPFSNSTKIQFYLENAGSVTITILNMQGIEIKTLLNQKMDSGNHSVTWDGRDYNGNEVNPGVYVYQMKVNSVAVKTKRLIILR